MTFTPVNEVTLAGLLTAKGATIEQREGRSDRLTFTLQTIGGGESGRTYIPVSLWADDDGNLAYEGQPFPGAFVALTGTLAARGGRVFVNASAAMFDASEHSVPVKVVSA